MKKIKNKKRGLMFMREIDFENNLKAFSEEIKAVLLGNINTDNKDVLNYLALKIERVHAKYVELIVDEIKEDLYLWID